MTPDACTAIAADNNDGERNAILIGSTSAGGLLTELATTNAQQYGFAIDLSFQHKFEFLGGSTVGRDPVTFPVALVADEENFFTVSMTSSSNNKVTADNDKVKDNKFPNFTNGGVQKYGSEFDVAVESFKVFRTGDGNPFAQGAAQSFISEWSSTLGIGVEHDGIMVTGMVTVNDSLVVVGNVHNKGNMDGFMAKVSRDGGELDISGSSGKALEYFAADETSDDWIMNACADPTFDDFFYIVGATQGKADDKSDKKERKKNKAPVHVLVAKIDSVTLETVWQKQFDAVESEQIAAAAYGCDVVPIENLLYIAGTVEYGARMVQALEAPGVSTPSAGGDDIFVAQLSSLDGRLNWMRQVGSTGDDRVARGGGIKADANGNAIVYGDTTGSMFRTRQDQDAKARHSDPFVMLFDTHNGIHQPVIHPQPVISNSMTPTEFFNEFTTNQKKGWSILGITLAALVVLLATYCVCKRCGCWPCGRRGKQAPTIYDAAAADLGYHDDASNGGSARGGFGMGRFKDEPEKDGLHSNGPNLNYRDDNDGDFADDSAGGMAGNFHKTYSDLPQNGKEII